MQDTIAIEELTIVGYATLWGQYCFEGDAFAKDALKIPSDIGVRMLWQHDPDSPIGTWDSIEADETGLQVEGRIIGATECARDVMATAREGMINGLSVGFKTLHEKRTSAPPSRVILEAELWEVSLVTFPMLPEARFQVVGEK